MKRMTHRLVFVLAVRRLHHAPTFSSGRAETLWSKVTVAPEKSWMAWMSGLTVIPRGAFRCSASSRMKGPAASFRWLSWSTTLFRKLARMAATQSFLFPAHHTARGLLHMRVARAPTVWQFGHGFRIINDGSTHQTQVNLRRNSTSQLIKPYILPVVLVAMSSAMI